MILYQAFCFIAVISLVVIVHEFGHYIVARACGVKVVEFAMGFGYKLFSVKDSHGTDWQLRLWPLGGYVKMHGDENPASMNAVDLAKIDKNDSQAFYNKNLKQKFAIVVAGPAFNYILAIFLYAFVACFNGVSISPNVVGNVLLDGSAYTAGLRIGDEIFEINGRKVNSFGRIGQEIMLSVNPEIQMNIIRNNKIISLNIKNKVDAKTGKKSKTIGISGVKTEIQTKSFLDGIKYGISESYNISAISLRALKQIITGHRSPRELGGPIKIATSSASATQMGIIGIILFSAFISVNLGLMNLLPIPLLDGGHLFFYMVEGLVGRPIPQFIYKILLYIGMAILGGLMAFTLVNDLIGIF